MRRLMLMLVFALACVSAHAADQYQRYNGSCAQGGARVLTNGVQSSTYVVHSFPSCTVTVYIHGTLNKATLFSDAAGAFTLTNPFTATSKGDANWYAPDARYDVQYSSAIPPQGSSPNNIPNPFTVSDIRLCFACTGGGGGGGNGNATSIQGVPVATTSPVNSQFLGFNGSVWTPSPITGFLPLTGGTLSGPLVLFGNPIGTNDAANKSYVDTKAAGKADLVSGLVPTNELGTGTAILGNCLNGNQTYQPCGGATTFPVVLPSATTPQINFTDATGTGLTATVSGGQVSITSITVTGSAGNQTVSMVLSTPIRPISWSTGDTFVVTSLPSSPTDLTSLNSCATAVCTSTATHWTVLTATANSPNTTSTVTFTAPTSIGVSTYAVTAGSAAIIDGYLAGHMWAVNRLDSTTSVPAQHGSIRFARRDAVVSRTNSSGMDGIDNVLTRGSQLLGPVNAVGTGFLTVASNTSIGATSIPIAKGAGANWLAKAGDVIEVAHANGDAEKQDYIVASDTTVTQGTTTSLPVTSVLGNVTGTATALTAGDLVVVSRIQAQIGDASGIEVLGPGNFLGDINVYGNINQLGTGAWQLSGNKQAGVTVTVAQGRDFSIFLGSDNLFHCQLSALLGGGSCGGSGGGGGVSSVALATPNAFSVTGSPITGAGTLTIGYGSGQIPIANLATGTPNGLKFIRDDGTLVSPLTFTGTAVSTVTVTSPIVGGLVANALTLSCPTCLPFTGALTNGNLLSNNGTQAVDSGVVAANAVTATSNFTSGSIPKAGGANKTLTNGYTVQGTDTALMTSGIISGVGSSLCTDAQFGITTVGCSSGTSVVQISGTPAANQVAVWTNATTIQGLAATGTLGSPVYSVSPTLVTPNIGVATATTVNKVTLTTPATAATLTILNNKTFAVNNSLTLAGTDATVQTFPSTSGTVVTSVTTAAGDLSGTYPSPVVAQVNGAVVPLSATVVGSNASRQLIAATLQGNGTKVQLSTGATVTSDCVQFDANGNTVDAGTPCGGGGTGNTTSTSLTTNFYPKANGANSIINGCTSDDGTTVTVACAGGLKTGTTGTGQWLALEGAAPSGVALSDLLYAADATGPSGGHRWAMKNNNGLADVLVGQATTDIFTNKTFDTGFTGNVFKINGSLITSVTGNTSSVVTASGALINGNLSNWNAVGNLVDSGVIAAQVPTAASTYTSGNLIQGASSATRQTSDSGVAAVNVVTAASNFTIAHIPKAGGNNKTLVDGFAASGTGTTLATTAGSLTNGNCVSIDANSNLVDNGSACSGGGGTPAGASGTIQYNNAGAFGGITQWSSNGTTTMTAGATAVLNLAAMAPTTGLTLPSVAGAIPTADGRIGVNTTTHATVWGSNGTTIVGAAAAIGTNTNTVCAANNWVSTVSSVAIPTCTQPGISNLSSSTSAQLATVLSDETGSGLAVFNTSPTLVTPALGAATATSIAVGTSPPTCTAGTAGVLCQNEGTAPTAASAVGQLYSDSTLHDFSVSVNGGGTGILQHTAPGTINQTAKTAAITTATLCAASAGACNQVGQYRVHWNFWGSGTACANVTAGSVTFLLTWTDENAVAHSAVALQMMGQTGAATEAMGSTFPFQTALANESASGDFTISTNGAVIQYATGYTACTTGTGTYNLRAAVTRIQ